MTKLLLVAAGGAAGSLLRYGISGLTYRYVEAVFPWGTLAVNLLGSFAIGFMWAVSERVALPPGFTAFLFIGLLGAFTTFSTYSLESINLLRDGEVGYALLNLAASNLLGYRHEALSLGLAAVCPREGNWRRTRRETERQPPHGVP